MKSTTPWIITAILLIVLGSIIFVAVIAGAGFDFNKLSTAKYVTNEHEINAPFSGISLNTDTADIIFEVSEDGEYRVICYENERATHKVEVAEGELKITLIDEREWYEHIGFGFSTPKITVSIPAGEYGTLSVNTDTGDTIIPSHFSFDKIKVEASTGDISCFASAKAETTLNATTGAVRIEDISTGSLEVEVSTGRVSLKNIECEGNVSLKLTTGYATVTNLKSKSLNSIGSTGEIELNGINVSDTLSVERSTGDVELTSVECGEMTVITDTGDVELERVGCDKAVIKTDTGDVEGTLSRVMYIIAKSDTGRVKHPESVSDKRCEITTDTGDIFIEYDEIQ